MGRRDPSPVHPSIVRAVHKLRHVDKKLWKFIADTFGHGETWGINLLKRYNGAAGLPFEERRKPGPTKKINANYQQCVLNLVQAYRDWTGKDIANFLRNLGIVDVSVSTMNLALKELKIRKVPAVRDVLTKRHKEIRLEWCNMMRIGLMVKPWLFESWLISDEVRVSLDGQGQPKIYVLKGESRFDEHLQVNNRLIDWLLLFDFCTCIE